jgi:hypothetical protein
MTAMALAGGVAVAPQVLADARSDEWTFACPSATVVRFDTTDAPEPVAPGERVTLRLRGPYIDGAARPPRVLVVPLPGGIDRSSVTATGMIGFGAPVTITVGDTGVTMERGSLVGVTMPPTTYTADLTITAVVAADSGTDAVTWALPSFDGCSPVAGQAPLHITPVVRAATTTAAVPTTAPVATTTVPVATSRFPHHRSGLDALLALVRRVVCAVLSFACGPGAGN